MFGKTKSEPLAPVPGLLIVLYAAAITPAIILFVLWGLNTIFSFPFPQYPLTLYFAGSPLGVVPTFAVAFANNVVYGLPLLVLVKFFRGITAIYWLPLFAAVGYFGGMVLYWIFTFPHEFLNGYPYGLLGVSSSTAIWYLGIFRDTGQK